MKLTQPELILVGLLIVYIAFFTHPVPQFISKALMSPVGHAIALGGILYMSVYQSLIVGVFLAIAYVMSTSKVTEYMHNPPPAHKKEEEPKQPSSSGVPSPAVTGALASLLKKGDTRLPQTAQKKGSTTQKPLETTKPKASQSKSLEHFASF